MECLKAILVVLTSIQEQIDLYPKAEEIIIPSLKQQISPSNLEYFEDFSRIISCFACFSPNISESMWEFIPLLCGHFESWAFDFLPSKSTS